MKTKLWHLSLKSHQGDARPVAFCDPDNAPIILAPVFITREYNQPGLIPLGAPIIV